MCRDGCRLEYVFPGYDFEMSMNSKSQYFILMNVLFKHLWLQTIKSCILNISWEFLVSNKTYIREVLLHRLIGWMLTKCHCLVPTCVTVESNFKRSTWKIWEVCGPRVVGLQKPSFCFQALETYSAHISHAVLKGEKGGGEAEVCVFVAAVDVCIKVCLHIIYQVSDNRTW